MRGRCILPTHLVVVLPGLARHTCTCRDPAALASEAASGSVTVAVDGKRVSLALGKELFLTASAAYEAAS